YTSSALAPALSTSIVGEPGGHATAQATALKQDAIGCQCERGILPLDRSALPTNLPLSLCRGFDGFVNTTNSLSNGLKRHTHTIRIDGPPRIDWLFQSAVEEPLLMLTVIHAVRDPAIGGHRMRPMRSAYGTRNGTFGGSVRSRRSMRRVRTYLLRAGR